MIRYRCGLFNILQLTDIKVKALALYEKIGQQMYIYVFKVKMFKGYMSHKNYFYLFFKLTNQLLAPTILDKDASTLFLFIIFSEV